MATVREVVRLPPLQYHPLPTNTCIRVIQLLPSDGESICCLLNTVDLMKEQYLFNAASYTWENANTIHERLEEELDFMELINAKRAMFPPRFPDEIIPVTVDRDVLKYRVTHPFIAYEKVG